MITILCLMMLPHLLHGYRISEKVKSLQQASNGFDLRGIITDGKDGPLLSNDIAFWVGFGFAKWVQSRNEGNIQTSIGIGRDSRCSGVSLSDWLVGGVEAAGSFAFDVGLATTPSMFYCCNSQFREEALSGSDPFPWPFHGAISVTASHLPQHWNGFKLFTPETPTNIGSEGLTEIIEPLQKEEKKKEKESFLQFVIPSPVGQRRDCPSFLPAYSRFLQHTVKSLCKTADPIENSVKSGVEKPLMGLKICVNAGNGAGGFLAGTFEELGADVSASLYLEPDGTFPHHVANPEDPVAIAATAAAVLEKGADLGVCLDTDADRVGFVDRDGRLLNRNGLVALVSSIAISQYFVKTEGSGGKKGLPVVVTDSATSNGLRSYIEDTLGGSHFRYKKGYRYVIEKGRSIPNCVAAVECSGHGGWLENGWVDDGCYTAVRVIAALASQRAASKNSQLSLADLITGLREPAESTELRCRILGSLPRLEEVLVQEISLSPPLSANQPNSLREGVTRLALARLRSYAEKTTGWMVEPENYEGLRVRVSSIVSSANVQNSPEDIEDKNAKKEEESELQWTGWCMLRLSLHEPILSVQLESELPGQLAVIVQTLVEMLEDLDPKGGSEENRPLDLEALRSFIFI